MSLYDKIKTIVSAGHIAITKDEDGEYNLRSSMSGEDIRTSGNYNTIESCYENLGAEYATKEEIQEYEDDDEKYIGIYQKPIPIPKQGDMVQVLENVKQLPWYEKNPQLYGPMIGLSFEVQRIDGGSVILYKFENNLNDLIYLTLCCVAPFVEPDIDDGIKIIDGKRYKLLD